MMSVQRENSIEIYSYSDMDDERALITMGVQLNQIARVLNGWGERWAQQDKRIGRVERHLWVGYGVVGSIATILGYAVRGVL